MGFALSLSIDFGRLVCYTFSISAAPHSAMSLECYLPVLDARSLESYFVVNSVDLGRDPELNFFPASFDIQTNIAPKLNKH